jgi:hypothetical protein
MAEPKSAKGPNAKQQWLNRHNETTRVAGEIMAKEKSAESAKTARLRAARLARDKADQPVRKES